MEARRQEALQRLAEFQYDPENTGPKVLRPPQDPLSHEVSRHIPQHLKDDVVRIQDWKCPGCSGFLFEKIRCYDHKIPFAIGGKTNLRNLQALCGNCHNYKTRCHDNQMIQRWREWEERNRVKSFALCYWCKRVHSKTLSHDCPGQERIWREMREDREDELSRHRRRRSAIRPCPGSASSRPRADDDQSTL